MKKVMPSSDKGLHSFEKADDWINESKKNLNASAFGSCISSSYMAMFHSSRAILFRDGVREKSHFCIARYLEKYVENDLLEEDWVFLLDRIRDVRHMDQYGIEHFATDEEAISTFKSAKSFVKRMKQLFDETDALYQ
ncbi:MAG: HEPN domain-containing protein [Candidatus Thermoplasmatota archaeon]|nr:HEPN domain-containing protein [Candidatus Thermoplasmatota archaeon]